MYRQKLKNRQRRTQVRFTESEKYMKAKFGFRQKLKVVGRHSIRVGNRVGDYLSSMSIPEIQGFKAGAIKLKIKG